MEQLFLVWNMGITRGRMLLLFLCCPFSVETFLLSGNGLLPGGDTLCKQFQCFQKRVLLFIRQFLQGLPEHLRKKILQAAGKFFPFFRKGKLNTAPVLFRLDPPYNTGSYKGFHHLRDPAGSDLEILGDIFKSYSSGVVPIVPEILQKPEVGELEVVEERLFRQDFLMYHRSGKGEQMKKIDAYPFCNCKFFRLFLRGKRRKGSERIGTFLFVHFPSSLVWGASQFSGQLNFM